MQCIINGDPGKPVEISWVSPWFMKATTHGGTGKLPGDAITIDQEENLEMRIEISESMPLERAVENTIASGFSTEFAEKYVNAIIAGGETDAGALDLARRKIFFDQGEQILGDENSYPASRFFRNAWRRIDNIVIVDLDLAKIEFSKKIIHMKKEALQLLETSKDLETLTGISDPTDQVYDELVKMDLRGLGQSIMASKSPEELEALWPTAATIFYDKYLRGPA